MKEIVIGKKYVYNGKGEAGCPKGTVVTAIEKDGSPEDIWSWNCEMEDGEVECFNASQLDPVEESLEELEAQAAELQQRIDALKDKKPRVGDKVRVTIEGVIAQTDSSSLPYCIETPNNAVWFPAESENYKYEILCRKS